ncbi:MAG: uroporphyrinogen decarboxylase family protein [Thermodesulfobacteriota bacterium]
MDKNKLTAERFNRIQRAVSLEKQDRIPVVLGYSGFASYVTQIPMCEFIRSPADATKIMIQAYKLAGKADAINYGSFSPYHLCELFGAKVKVPGYDLPDNDMWQVLETELMKKDDYDAILNIGWENFFDVFMKEKILNDADVNLLRKREEKFNVRKAWDEIGVPVLSGGDITTPFDLLCGARSLEKFFMDLIKIPDKIEKVMDVIVTTLVKSQCKQAKEQGYSLIWVGGWRTAPCMISSQMWDRFVWPYFSKIVNEVIDYGLIPILHLDSNWNRELKRFRELPKRKMIMALDGDTDIFLAKKQLGDHLCIMGDVPPGLLAFGTKSEVYSYCNKLINKMGSRGFILHSGCDIPANAKLENVQTMVEIALDE